MVPGDVYEFPHRSGYGVLLGLLTKDGFQYGYHIANLNALGYCTGRSPLLRNRMSNFLHEREARPIGTLASVSTQEQVRRAMRPIERWSHPSCGTVYSYNGDPSQLLLSVRITPGRHALVALYNGRWEGVIVNNNYPYASFTPCGNAGLVNIWPDVASLIIRFYERDDLYDYSG